MSESKFKTMRHIETVRNYLNHMIEALMHRQSRHDQTKLQSPEVEIFEEFTSKLRDCTYGSVEYKGYLKAMNVALEHHYLNNRHHPEHFQCGVKDMNLIDLIEMLCDWNAATLRHNDGNIMESIELNQERFGYSDELKAILINTACLIQGGHIFHKANES